MHGTLNNKGTTPASITTTTTTKTTLPKKGELVREKEAALLERSTLFSKNVKVNMESSSVGGGGLPNKLVLNQHAKAAFKMPGKIFARYTG